MSFSWNKWRQYIIEEASVNEMDTYESEILGLFKFAVQLGVLEPQDYSDVEKVAMDPDAYEEGLDFNAVAATKMVKALTKIFNIVSPTVSSSASRIYDKLQGGEELDGTDLGNALQIYNKFQDQEAGNTSPEDLDAAADKLGNMEEGMSDVVNNPKPGFMPDKILKSFIEDFEKASMSTDDIPYAQEEVIDAYKKTFPHMDEFIDLWLEQNHNKELKKFQNVADDPEVRGMDMMGESYENDPEFAPEMPKKGSTFEKGQTVYLKADKDKQRPMKIKRFGGLARMSANPNEKEWVVTNADGDEATYTQSELIAELEGEVQTEIDAFDEAQNDMAIERAAVATKLDAMQNDLEATLSQDEIDTLSDAIVLLRQK